MIAVFFNVFERDWYLMVSAEEVDLGKDTLTVQMLRKVFDMRRVSTCRVRCGRSTHGSRRKDVSLRLSSIRHAAVMPMDSLIAVSLLAPSSSQTPSSLESVGCEASRFAEDEGPRSGFDVVYHIVASFFLSKKGWTDCLDRYGFSRGRVSCRR